MRAEAIIGKYKVYDPTCKGFPRITITDNALEAVWEANRRPNMVIQNICGEKQFYNDGNKWRIIKEAE